MKRYGAVIAVALLLSAGVALAQSSDGWHVIARGASEPYVIPYASASADHVTGARAVRIRGFGKKITTLSGDFYCELRDRHVPSGSVIVLRIAAAKSCFVGADAHTRGGLVKVQIEKLDLTGGLLLGVGSKTGWDVVARQRAVVPSTIGAVAAANVSKAEAMRIRGFGKKITLGGDFRCTVPKQHVRSGTAIVLRVAVAKCYVQAWTNSNVRQVVKVQIEKR